MRANPYVQTTAQQEQEMLAAVGAASIEQLFEEQVPPELLLSSEDFRLPAGLPESQVLARIQALAGQCVDPASMVSFLGGGCYDHFVPAAVEFIANRAEFVTAYTPYQPEASQGTLQAFFEYQTLTARLYGMDVSNASLYDGATALAEAVLLALAVRPERRRIVLPCVLHADYGAVVKSYVQHLDVQIAEVPWKQGVTDVEALARAVTDDTAAVVCVQPNYFGCLEPVTDFERVAHAHGALLVAVADPFSLGLLAPPGEYGADIAVGEGQSVGLRPYLGGQTVGIFTCRQEFLRRMPGRLVGLTRDRKGRRGYVLTLQTREQHIRREKATSNICTNHAHNALKVAIYLALVGPEGLKRLARHCARNLALFRRKIMEISPKAVAFPGPAFRELTLKLRCPAREAVKELAQKGIFAGIPLDRLGEELNNHLLVAVTEKRTDEEIHKFVHALCNYV